MLCIVYELFMGAISTSIIHLLKICYTDVINNKLISPRLFIITYPYQHLQMHFHQTQHSTDTSALFSTLRLTVSGLCQTDVM